MQYIIFLILFLFPLISPFFLSPSLNPVTRLHGKSSSKKTKKKPATSGGGGFGGALKKLKETTFGYTGTVTAYPQTPQSKIPSSLLPKSCVPSYASSSVPAVPPPTLPWVIERKTPEMTTKMERAGEVARQVLETAGGHIKEGVTTEEIDRIVHEECLKNGAYPSPLNYHGFPKSCCTSINEVICHGIPDSRKLESGDIVNLDITVYKDGYHGDCSEMFVVGETDARSEELIQVTYDCWLKAMNFCRPGKSYSDIGAIIEDYVSSRGFSTVRTFCGHGIGSVFHTNPNILHYRNSEPNGKMEVGHTFTIEPMICMGTNKHVTWPDEWTAATKDGGRTAQFEHTLLIEENGVRPLTGKREGDRVQWWEERSEVHKGIWKGSFD